LALFLGFIPGVGAFYNGQFLKGFVHVIVLATLIWMSDHGMETFAGFLIAAWIFYMVFDAYTTAKARRDGLPIPDPLGLNHILEGKEGTFKQRVEQAGERLGVQVENVAQNIGQQWQKSGAAPPGARAAGPGAPPPPGSQPFSTAYDAASTAASSAVAGAVSGAGQGVPPGSTAYAGSQGTYYSGPQGTYYGPPKEREHSPAGAVVLIGLGVLFLLANLGWFSFHWVNHFWPAVLIVVGVWLFVKRQRGMR
jgi:hypothetical protein